MAEKIVTVVGATGGLGLKIVKALLNEKAHVRALVRASSDRTALEKLGVDDFVVADMLDPEALQKAVAFMPKADAIVASAAGYTHHTKGDSPKTDTQGYRNLVDAAKAAAIPRFVLISILECDKATAVPHFYHKYLIEQYLKEKGQPFIALRPGAFLDQAIDFVLPKIQKGIFPAMFQGVALGMIYTPDLARYAALAATMLSDNMLNTAVDVGWDQPAAGESIASAFSKILGKPIVAKPAYPPFAVNIMMPFIGLFVGAVKDMNAMIRWIKSGEYTSKNTQLQKKFFSELPTIEEAVRRYCRDRKLV